MADIDPVAANDGEAIAMTLGDDGVNDGDEDIDNEGDMLSDGNNEGDGDSDGLAAKHCAGMLATEEKVVWHAAGMR